MKSALLARFILAESAVGHAGKAISDQLTSILSTIRSAAVATACILAAHPAAAENIDPSRGQFVASRTWYQVGDDKEESLFRAYAVLVTDGNLIDSPNLFVMSCPRDGKPYITLHFPPNYVFKGFGPDTWLPKTDLGVRIAGGTFSFDAELNTNEFHVDLGETEFDYLHEIWAADGPVDLKLGPAQSDVALIFAPMEDVTHRMLTESGLKVTSSYAFLEMRTRCLAAAMVSEASQDWKIFGSVNCTDCDKSDEKTFTFFTIDRREGSNTPQMRSAEGCDRVRQKLLVEFEENTKGQTLVADLLCIGDGGWQ